MTVFFTLVKRNMMVYYKDKGNVFFSFLSMLIILGLMVLFLGEMNVDAITALLDQYGGIRDSAVDLSNAKNLILNWVAAGIIVVNSITIAIGVVGIIWFVLRQIHGARRQIENPEAQPPLLNLSVLKNRSFTVGTITAALSFFAFSSIMVIMPLYIQDCRGYSAAISGLVMLPGALGQCIS